MIFDVYDLGLIEYQPAWDLQNRLAAEVASGERPPALLLLEHPHTYTFGRKGHAENMRWDEHERARRGIGVHWVDRGGDVTYHGPGQIVGYPLIPLGRVDASGRLPRVDYIAYLRKLEKTVIIALARLGLGAGQIPGLTGVWVQPDLASRCPRCKPEDREKPAKIAAIGVKVDALGITRHGFSLNVDPDMSYWEGIVACGIDYPLISLADLLAPVPGMPAVKKELIEAFGVVFEYQWTQNEIDFFSQSQ